MVDERAVPESIYSFLRAAATARTAWHILRDVHRQQQHAQRSIDADERPAGSTNRLLHPGDRFGDYLIWLWRSDQRSEVVLILADLLAELRYHADDADPSITLEEMLRSTRLALTPLSAEEKAALLEAAREGVPPYFEDDVTRPG